MNIRTNTPTNILMSMFTGISTNIFMTIPTRRITGIPMNIPTSIRTSTRMRTMRITATITAGCRRSNAWCGNACACRMR